MIRLPPGSPKRWRKLATDPTFNLGNYGYTVVRARGHGASGLSVRKNTKPASGAGGLNHENPGHAAGDSEVSGEICQDHKPVAQSRHNPTS